MTDERLPRILPTSREMIRHLDRFVFGQTDAKRDLCTAVYNHYIGRAAQEAPGGDELPPGGGQHTLLIGGTGTGKSYLVKTLAAYLKVPFTYVSATSLVQTGYTGMPVEHIVRDLYQRSGEDTYLAEHGIVFVDEVDKLRRQPTSSGPDVSGEGVQIGLLTLLDGREVRVSDPNASPIYVNTSRVLFIFAGAFVGLEAEIRNRLGAEATIGFVRKPAAKLDANPLEVAEPEDLIKFGLIPELVGRIGTISTLQPLGQADLCRILTDTEGSAFRRKQAFWRLHGIELDFTDGALMAIADLAAALGTGARALHRIVESCLDEVDYQPVELMEAGVVRIVVTEAAVRSGAPVEQVKGERAGGPAPVVELRARALVPSPPVDGEAAQRIPSHTGGTPIMVTNTKGWPDEKVTALLEKVKAQLDWPNTTGSARKWWEAFENENRHRWPLVLRLAEELAGRKATITEFFLAYVYSNTDNIQANLHYLDYTRLKKEEEAKRKKQAGEKRPEEEG